MQCSLCKTEIEDAAYVELSPNIVQQDPNSREPIIFTSPAQRSFYSTKLVLHDKCFIKLIGTRTELKLEGGLGLIPVSS